MQNIHVSRNVGEGVCPNGHQGTIEPEDGSWRLILDRDGVPHLMVRSNVEMEGGEIVKGYFAVEDMFPDGVTIADIMQSTFGGVADDDQVGDLSQYNSAKLFGWDKSQTPPEGV